MGATIIGVGDAKAVKRYSSYLFVDTARAGYWSRKFTGKGETASTPVQRLTDLESSSGDQITYDLSMQLTMQPVEGDNVLEGNEEALRFYSDSVYIDQMRGGVNSGGRMTRKRTLHDLRKVSRRRQSEWWARVFDELHFMYASGARGVNADFVYPTSYTGFAGNSFSSPDAYHIVYGDGTTKETLTSGGTMKTGLIDKAVAKAKMMGGGTQSIPQIQPLKMDGGEHYVLLMCPYQTYALKSDTGETGWLALQKAAAGAEGRKAAYFTGALGMHNGVILHEHKAVIRFSDYGSGANLTAARALFLGEQSLVIAHGSAGNGLRFKWDEDTDDRGNQLIITTSAILGLKKVTFNGLDYGVMAIDTYYTAL